MHIRTLHDLGKAIEAMDAGYQVSVRKSKSSTDRHPRGCRYRIEGRGRKGLKIEVERRGKLVWEYDTSRTYHDLVRGINGAVEVFGPKFNPDPDLIKKGTPVRVRGTGMSREGIVVSRKMRTKTRAESYGVRIIPGNVILPYKPYELIPDKSV